MKYLSLFLVLMLLGTGIGTAAKAEPYQFVSNSKISLCWKASETDELINAAALPNYWSAVARLDSMLQQPCWSAVVSRAEVHEVLFSDALDKKTGYNRIEKVRFDCGGKKCYSVIVRNNFDLWEDGPNTMIGMRTLGGIFDFLKN